MQKQRPYVKIKSIYNEWSKTSIEGVVNYSRVLKKITPLNKDLHLLEIEITEGIR